MGFEYSKQRSKQRSFPACKVCRFLEVFARARRSSDAQPLAAPDFGSGTRDAHMKLRRKPRLLPLQTSSRGFLRAMT
ncbi:hypothetical protein [Caballeronia catudaia]|uniref:hypothetical protein n=1 Tax=Caballeronia catudaia TaxID=1777136 RepID=UPI000B079DD1|nr:hypothetical protein [Caballeronia catudaia]